MLDARAETHQRFLGEPQFGAPDETIGIHGHGLSQAGVEQWFTEAVLPLAPSLTRFLCRNAVNPSDIPDFLQELYIRACEAARREIPHSIQSFLFQVARNLLIDQRRRRNARAIVVSLSVRELDFPASEPTPEQTAGARQELRQFQRVLETLPPRIRQTIALRRVDGLSQRETAERLGVTEKAIERNLAAGLRQLAAALQHTDLRTGRYR